MVWVIYPKHQVIYFYESVKSIRVLDLPDTLDGGKILPDFRLSVAKLFEQPSAITAP
jgi:hypothetical protein